MHGGYELEVFNCMHRIVQSEAKYTRNHAKKSFSTEIVAVAVISVAQYIFSTAAVHALTSLACILLQAGIGALNIHNKQHLEAVTQLQH
jgi:multisubunit Na+/H+ antiporter MnhG subunit